MQKTVLITGAAKGIGAAIAKEFASLNEYNICITYNNSEKEAVKLKEEIKQKYGINISIYMLNIENRKNVDNVINQIVEKYGKIDILVNNAGICEYKLFSDVTNYDFEKIINTNVIGTFNVTQEVIKKCMLPNKNGIIINISSIWGIVGASCEVSYSISKAAINGMTKALAKEYALSNIRVNAVAPGSINTDMMKDFSDEDLEFIKSEIPLNRIGDVEDIAGVVSFLASDKAKYITGQIISPNGGSVI